MHSLRVMDPREVIIFIQYTAWLAIETENHTVVQFLAPGFCLAGFQLCLLRGYAYP